MFFTSKKKYFTNNGRAIHINEDSGMPQLHRLCSDFGFAVLGLCERSATPKSYALCEVDLFSSTETKNPEKVSPEFTTLYELEAYVTEHVVEIVQKYLFGEETPIKDGDGNNSSVA